MGGWIYRDRQCTGRVAEGGREGENGKTKRKAADADVRTGAAAVGDRDRDGRVLMASTASHE